MRLRGWHVEGFGVLHDFGVEDLTDGLTIVYGPNESGKTSLLAFIRGVFFGYPDRRQKERQYPPLRGGRHGGRVFVESDQSTWTVERFASPAHLSITQPNGSIGSDGDLRRLLGGVDAGLYRNVFAFSLAELQELKSLEVEGVRERIFAAGVVGAGRSARAAIKALAAERAEIGKKRGACLINDLRKQVDDLDEKLRQAKSRATRHPDLRRDADDLDEEQTRIGRDLTDARREMAHLDTLLAAWPDWDEREHAKQDLLVLANTPDVPSDLGTRLDTALAAAQLQRERHEERTQIVNSLQQQLDALVPDDRLAAVSTDVTRLTATVSSVRARRERIGELRGKHASLSQRVAEEAPRLGAGWTTTSVRAFNASIPAAQDIADWGERLRMAEQAARDAEAEAARRAASAQELADEALRRTQALEAAPPLPDAQALAARAGTVRRLRTSLAQLVELRADLRAATERLAEARRLATDALGTADAKDAERERRAEGLEKAPPLPIPDDLARLERAVRELRAGLAELTAARADLRAATQRAQDAMQRAEEAENTASMTEVEVALRAKALADAPAVPDAGSIAASERTIRELRSRLVDLALLRSDLRAAEARVADRRSDAERPRMPMDTSTPRRLLLAAAGILCLLAAGLAFTSQTVAAGLAVVIAVLAAILAMRLSVDTQTAPDDRSVGIADAERRAQELAAQIEALTAAVLPLAARLDFSSLPDQVAVNAKADDIAGQLRARQNRDRDAEAVDRLREEAKRAHELAQRLRTNATTLRAEADNVASPRVQHLEATNLTTAKVLAFAELPTIAELEEKATAIRDLVEKRRERDREESAVQALTQEATDTRNVANRLGTEFAELQKLVELDQAARVGAAEESAQALAVSLAFAAIPEPDELEVKAQQLDNQIRARQERHREATEVEQLRLRAETARNVATNASAVVDQAQLARDETRAGWSAWKVANGCPESLRPDTAQQFFASVERLRERVAQLDGMDAEIARSTAELHVFSQAVHDLAERAGAAPRSDTQLAEDTLEGLRDRVEADATLRVEQARVRREREQAGIALSRSERNVHAASDVAVSLFAEAEAVDERDCRVRMETSRQRAELKKTIRDAEHRVHARLGVGTQADAIRAELTSGDLQGWEARKQECKGVLARSQPAHEDALRRHQTALEALSALERESDVVTLATEREGVIGEIREALVEWRRLAIAQALMQETLRRYELERQPAVLTRAGASFSRITEGRYTQLVTREDGIDVLGADGSRLDAALLSRGAAEQLYLCLRLALAAEFGRLAVPLPLVMDDVLVNFDPERTRLSAQVLIDAAPEHQMLLFTCHPETVDVLIALEQNVKVITIDRQVPAVQSAPGASSPADAPPLRLI